MPLSPVRNRRRCSAASSDSEPVNSRLECCIDRLNPHRKAAIRLSAYDRLRCVITGHSRHQKKHPSERGHRLHVDSRSRARRLDTHFGRNQPTHRNCREFLRGSRRGIRRKRQVPTRSGRRWIGFSPIEKRRLITAHTRCGPSNYPSYGGL